MAGSKQSLRKTVTIGARRIGDGHPPYIIAEMACAHDGDVAKAIRIVDAAADAGADAIQLQLFVPEETVTPQHEVFELLHKLAMDEGRWSQIARKARERKLQLFICTYDLPSVSLAKKLGADGIKLNSADLSNPELVIEVARSGIPFTLGTGASTVSEIEAGVKLAEKHGAKGIVLMHGVQNFPTLNQDLHIAKLGLLRSAFNWPAGYHDHTSGDDPFSQYIDLVAVGMGANVIEKHITWDRSEKGTDHQASLNPAEFAVFVKNIRRAWEAVGSAAEKPFSESELRYRKFQKKSIVAARDIQPGEIITRELVKFLRNAEPGLPPSEFVKLEGKKAKVSISSYSNISQDLLY